MRKVINGKMYDTETAKLVGEWNNGAYTTDFNFVEELLYQKKTGEFFLYGHGGAMSKYCKEVGNNSWIGSCQIIPLTFEAAREWAEDHLNGDAYEAIFGEIIEDDSKRVISTSITVSAHEKLKRIASEKGITVGDVIGSLLQ